MSDFLAGFVDWLEQLIPADRWTTAEQDDRGFVVSNAAGARVRVSCELEDTE